MEPLPTIEQQEELAELSSEGIGTSADALLALLVSFIGEELTEEEFKDAVKEEIRGEHIRQYALGRGGVGEMTAEDWTAVESLSEAQYDYFLGSFETFVAGAITALTFGARMQMYASSANLAYNQAMGARFGLIGFTKLPAYPCDGSTPCLTNCGCFWIFESGRSADGSIAIVRAYWRRGKTDSCMACIDRASAWNPYFLTEL